MPNKFILCCFLFLYTSKLSIAQVPKQNSPRNTLEEAFKAARTGNFSYLHLLCDPEGNNDGDTQKLCNLQNGTLADKLDYRVQFKLAHSLEEKYIDENRATVRFKFGKKAQLFETMNLVKRDNKWYLISF